MADGPPANNSVHLNRLTDHDLLVRIAAKVECLDEHEQRLRNLENAVTAIKAESRIITAVSTVIGAAVGSIFPRT